MWRRWRKPIGALAVGSIAVFAINFERNKKTHIDTTEIMRQKEILKNIPTREQQIKNLKSGHVYDVLVIGGGATGTGVALEAVTRGLSVALVEKSDFSSETSSRSTKLIHGGVRYLEKAFWELDLSQFQLVTEALKERSTVLHIAPHLTSEVPILIPIFQWWRLPYYWGGSKMYDLFAAGHGLSNSYLVSKTSAVETIPLLKRENLCAGMVYYDGQMNDSRLNLAIALTSAAYGANISNYVQVENLIKVEENGKKIVKGASVQDLLTGEKWDIKAKVVVNATGPFSDSIRKMDDQAVKEIVTPSGGTHIILPEYYGGGKMGLLDPATEDGRVIFILPWLGSTLVGTTDHLTEIRENPTAKEEEIEWLLKEVSKYLDTDVHLEREDVLSAWCGIRPLVKDPSKPNTESLARTHIVHASPSKLISVAGGKWTTFRAMAEDTVNEAISLVQLKPKGPSSTENTLLIGAHSYSRTLFLHLIKKYKIDQAVAEHLATTYGDKAFDVLDLSPNHKHLTDSYPILENEVLYGVRHEYARKAIDILARRTRLAYLNIHEATKATPRVIEIMAKELGWSKNRIQKETKETYDYLKHMGATAPTK